MNAAAPTSLDAFVSALTAPDCIKFCAERSGISEDLVHARFRDYAAEVPVGVRLLDPIALEGKRVLEVGAGLGLLSAWLARQGCRVTMLEPGAGGFDTNLRLQESVLTWLDAGLDNLTIGAEDLTPSKHGQFDVVFSVNVLEHIPQWEAALTGMLSVLAGDGVMRHLCPNYAVPYEPHYNLPLLPFWPAKTAALYPRIAADPVWKSLNFITYSQITRFCRAHDLEYDFSPGMIAAGFVRIEEEEAFRARRGVALQHLQRLLRASGTLRWLERIPPRFGTPMMFTCWPRAR